MNQSAHNPDTSKNVFKALESTIEKVRSVFLPDIMSLRMDLFEVQQSKIW